MNCPACSCQLYPMTAADIVVDVCRDGCGGIWFDKSELEKFDEDTEIAPDTLLRARENMGVALDRNRKRPCPRCPDSVLKEHYFDSEYQIEVDECPSCNGIWLDFCELSLIRDQHKQRVARDKVINDYMERHKTAIQTGSLPKRVLAAFKLVF